MAGGYTWAVVKKNTIHILEGEEIIIELLD